MSESFIVNLFEQHIHYEVCKYSRTVLKLLTWIFIFFIYVYSEAEIFE